MQKQFGQQTATLFSDVFIAGLDGNLKTSKEIFRNYVNDLRNMIVRFMMEQAVAKMFNVIFAQRSTSPMPVPTSGSLVTPTPITTSYTVPTFQRGGIATRPTLALVGEQEPEAIVPLSKMGGGNTYNIFNITAVDMQSFADAIRRNATSVVAVTQKAIEGNKGLRRSIKQYT